MVTRHHRAGPRLTVVMLGVGALTAGLCSVASPATAAAPKLTSTPYGNLAEALQKSLYFYDAEMSGPSRSEGKQGLEWRGDSEPVDAKIPLVPGPQDVGTIVTEGTNLSASFISANKKFLDPDGDGTIDLSQGYHDAGDHVKFGLPQGYAASTLAWGLWEFKDAYVKTGTYDHLMKHLYWFNDYFLKSTIRNDKGEVIAFAFQTGNGSADHTYWGPPELQTTPRGAMFATQESPGSDVASQASAALTAMSLLTEEDDPAYSKKCAEAGKALYEFARKYRGLAQSGGYYGSADDNDELSWAAAWLYLATDDLSYVTHINSKSADGIYTGYLNKIIKDRESTWQNIWVHSWDVVWGGTFALLAPATKGKIDDAENQRYWYWFRWNIEYWTGGAVPHEGNTSGDSYMAASPSGYSVVATWGSARYNTAAQLCALVYRKNASEDPGIPAGHGEKLAQWALSQMNYIMGDNPLNRSYIVGFVAKDSDHWVQHPHHRAAHGSATNSMLVPAEHRHTLWGALAGGPDSKDEHIDETTDYVYNEVAIDYNAAFVGALAGLWTYFGQDQTVTRWTPPLEPTETPYYSRLKLEQENKARTQVTIEINNRVTHPPALVDDLSARYYFDISEMTANGQTVADLRTEVYYDESKVVDGTDTALSKPVQVSGSVYYVEASWKGIPFWGKREIQFGLIAGMDANWKENWDPSNDYSHEGISTSALADTTLVPVYRSGTLVHGAEPGGTSTTAAQSIIIQPTATPTPRPGVTLSVIPNTGATTLPGTTSRVTLGLSAS